MASEGKPRKRLYVNFMINLIGAITPLIVAILTVPLYIDAIGDARYGVLSLVWVLIGYFGFLDLGLSPATINAMAKIDQGDQPQRARVLITSLVINAAMAFTGAAVLYLAGHYLIVDLLRIPGDIEGEVLNALPWIALLLPLTMIGSVGIGAIEARENFVLANSLQVCGQVLGQIVPVIVAIYVSPELSTVVPAAALSRLVFVGVVLSTVFYIEGPVRLRDFDPSKARGLLSYGGWVSVSSLVTPLLNTLDQVMIGRLQGVAQVTYYAVPMNIIMRSQILTGAISRALFPRLSSSSRDDAVWISRRALLVAASLYAGVCACGILLAHPLLTLWMGPAFAEISTRTAVILLCAIWINSMTFAPYALLQGQGRPDITAKIHLVQVIPYVGLLWVLTGNLGIEGAALAFLIRAVLDLAALLYLARMGAGIVSQLLLPAVVVASAAILHTVAGTNWTLMFGLCFLVGAAVLALLFRQERATFDLLVNLAMRPLRRNRPAE